MITKTLNNTTLLALWIGLLVTHTAGAQELPALASVPTTQVAAAEVLAPLTAEVLAELDVGRLAKELTSAAQPLRVRLAAVPVPAKRATQEE